MTGGVIALTSGSDSNDTKPVASAPAATTVTAAQSAPPGAAPADASATVAAAGLPMLGTEGTALHIHSHLDIYVGGKAVAVPAEIGIDEKAQKISPLHTHDTSGVIHIESPTQAGDPRPGAGQLGAVAASTSGGEPGDLQDRSPS